MTAPKIERNQKIVHMKDNLKMTFRQISDMETLNGEPISEKTVHRIYHREKAKYEPKE